MNIHSNQQYLQESQYEFPYHYLPHDANGAWTISRYLWWGYEYLAILQTVIDLVVGLHPTNVLDFGCGDGRLIYELYNRGIPQISGIDVSERALLFSQSMGQYDDRVKFFSDIGKIGGESFDVAIAMEVIEHIPPDQTRSVIAAVYKALNHNGSFIVSVPTTNVAVHRKHYRHFTKRTLEQEIDGLFVIDRIYFVHRVGMFCNILRVALVNKFFIPLWLTWLRFTTVLYKRFVKQAEESNGAHLIAVLRKAHGGQNGKNG